MAGSRLAIGQAFRVEKIGEETIVFNRSSGETIHRVSGNAAEALRLIADGVDETDVPAQFRPAVDELVAAGVVEGSRVESASSACDWRKGHRCRRCRLDRRHGFHVRARRSCSCRNAVLRNYPQPRPGEVHDVRHLHDGKRRNHASGPRLGWRRWRRRRTLRRDVELGIWRRGRRICAYCQPHGHPVYRLLRRGRCRWRRWCPKDVRFSWK